MNPRLSPVFAKIMKPLDSLAAQFYHAFYEKEWPGGNGPGLSTLSINEAYEVQRLVADLRVQSGERVVGYKVGCTSRAIRTQFGLSEPICGRLFHPHVQEEGIHLDWSAYAHCAVEPEMVMRMGRDLRGRDLSDQDLLDSIEYVSPGIEIHHFTFWHGKPTLQELICSGGIHAGLIVGKEKVSPDHLRFGDALFSVYKDHDLVTSAPATEIMGGPLDALRWLVSFLAARGDYLKKDSWVIPGSPTALVEVDQDTELKVVIEQVGQVVAHFRKEEVNNPVHPTVLRTASDH